MLITVRGAPRESDLWTEVTASGCLEAGAGLGQGEEAAGVWQKRRCLEHVVGR